uniref:DUF1232 domain-containing protein n=1 Tax=uncultured Nocardioidaceae bacterium TaxID=253824 RepID=A0A6J4LRR5_9ACTN|nr:MAG: hypothetical protein AVDCRST_MAG46-1936 [uncultured Nocardioidaceae bacterium]
MDGWQHILLGLLGVIALSYAVLLGVLLLARPPGVDLRQAARLVPDVARLVPRLARDRTLPRGVRLELWLLLGYLVCPIDLVPDVLPVIGWADDVILVLLVLRSVVRRAGAASLERHWPGSAPGLAALRQLAGVPA